MKEQMAADEGVIYFLDNDDMPEFNFQGITEQTNFYFNEKDELVIAFDEYEVAPGSMGTGICDSAGSDGSNFKVSKKYLNGETPAYHETKGYAGVFLCH